eukprot:6190025-Pleurochrysis_carterae.AAC.3
MGASSTSAAHMHGCATGEYVPARACVRACMCSKALSFAHSGMCVRERSFHEDACNAQYVVYS